MEDLFLLIIKESTGTKHNALRQTAQIAYDKLYRQHGIHRDPSHELRSVCFTALQMALDTKRPKFITMGLNGLHRVIKDERFYIGLEPEDDSVWLPSQLLRATNGILPSTSSEDTVVNVLRLFLAMACSPACTLNGRLLIEILSRCGECWELGSRAIKAASLAAASQCLRTFCAFLIEEAEEVKKTAPAGLMTQTQASAVYNEVIPVMQWLCSRLVEPNVNNASPNKKCENPSSLYLTECILTLSSALPRNVHANPHFTSFLWQKFCPTLAAALGSPGRINLDKKFTYKDALHMIENEARGFFTGPGLDGPQARCVYLTAIQLLRIAGAHGSLRPMLEALFHRMVLLPAPLNRTEPLRCVREIFKSPERLIDLAVILYVDKNTAQGCSDEMALFRLLVDAMEECAYGASAGSATEASLQASVECMVALLDSLQVLCSGELTESMISDQIVQVVNARHELLKDADYSGPLTYQSMARLPAPYRDAIVEFRQNVFETSSGSESECEQPHEQDAASNGSGDTEGPEDDEPSSSSDETSRVENRWPYSHLEAPVMPIRTDSDNDRQHARDFAKALRQDLVPKLLRLRSCVELDEAMQEFASAVCQENSMNFSDFDYNLTAINADGIYLAIYSSLLLSLQLMRAGYYDQHSVKESILVPMSEQQFVTSVQNTGVLVYLSSPWLCELYQSVIISNILEAMTRQQLEGSGPRCALVDMLCDAGGLASTQMLSEWQRLQTATVKHSDDEQHDKRREAAKKLCRRLLTCCWDSMVIVLSSGLGDLQSTASNKLVALSKRTLRVKAKTNKSNGEALYAMCLDGLHSAATLSNSLNLQHLAGKILNLLASNVCQTSGPRISASQAMSMDVVLTGGLNLGSYSADCWQSIFAVCRHVSQLEHEIFSMQNPSIAASPGSSRRDLETGEKLSNGNAQDKLNLSSIPIDDDETCVDVYSFLQAPLQSPNTNITSILKVYSGTNETVLLSQSDTSKVLCALSHQAENLFSDAAERLSLPSLCQFLKHLCRASRDQLYKSQVARKGGGTRIWWPSKGWKKIDSLPMSLLLHRIGDVTLKVFRSSRPLLHVLKVWAITGPHLMDAACHRDRMISKRAIEYIHDIITALLVEQSELPYFHFNEALLKPFENLLSMDTCDVDVQDQIVACLYEIVEAHRTEIRSGWRPLFGTLRNARSRMLNMSNIIDIFRVFLDSDNTLVFANAGLDCILCLLSYLEISGNSGAGNSGSNNNACGEDNDNTFRPTDFLHETLRFLERCSSILGFMYSMPKCPNFHSTYKIKGISYTHIIDANIPSSMENFTYFGNDYLQTKNEQYMISYRSLHIDKDTIVKIDEMDKPSGVLKVWFLLLDGLTNSLIVCPYSHQAPILQTIFKLFKNLMSTPGIDFGFYCINHLLIPMIQDWLRYINKTATSWQLIEKNFKHCCCMTTDLVVEFIEKSVPEQRRLGASTKTRLAQIVHPADNLIYSKLKFVTEQLPAATDGQQHAGGTQYDSCSSSASDEHNNSSNSNSTNPPNLNVNHNLIESPTKISGSATLALKQLLLVLIECAAQSQEAIARISVSCLKHVILSTGMLFNESQWMIACSAIHRACTVTIAPLRQLSFAFHEKSNSFYGDCANVKVAARRDSTLEELARIYALAQQVFLSDNQREPNQSQGPGQATTPTSTTATQIKSSGSGSAQLSDDRSYSFLLYPLNNGFNSNLDNFVIRIPFKNLVVGLLANQMLLQLVAKLLLSRLKCVPQAVSTCIFDNYAASASTPSHDYDLDFRSKEILLRCVKQYLMSALEFDSRPGLKFLMQKVSNIEYAANLYKQMTSSWMIYYIALVDSHLNDIVVYNLGAEDLNFILESCSRLNTTTVKKKENFVRYLFCLQDAWNLVCELYLSNSALHDIENGKLRNQQQKLPMHLAAAKSMCIALNGNGDAASSSANNHTDLGNDATCNGRPNSTSPSKCVQLEEENVTMTTLISEFQPKCRSNPFDTNRQAAKTEAESISPEIEQQRATSILKDSNYKRAALAQLVVASMELLRSLPNEAEENLKLLMTPTIREAFRLVQLQGNELKVNQF
ncbi:brefeldin A-inhibited guanine nucleotide-exchange protein 3 isoform X1 [Drosophila hydei]|uniref:Brefeldin A-inhibited guanine nucleotide-exchange protein 3 isoform X1 n=1 Tax=Drosophila hydei TaxID=7224 RepID=A0A6J1LRJ1_DROHY|nr:brefeldin A-inhibited guanine nucleotide-exchange protein 3 isoform X1 [Drosophila hydei]XP_023167633.2 brefeldin A-inhibited guanine nucleotide-exchange protein 3 isoform X1 [Drosophila hydei]XP_023167634.2 brefeldin A-inhibited guanine nucleotide-exchange protein 3 isoform X1 [Drosophila hydei]XP_023167636.2 brefeldin A-inhibited guanine nucleotide-exchange protein 3 isoform X1 [Drosophila hydei]